MPRSAVPILLLVGACGDGGGGVPPDPAAIVADFEARHAAVYQVYGLGPDRDRIHDLLATAFTGDALTDEYVEHFATLSRMARDDTQVEVVEVRHEASHLLPSEEDVLRLLSTWTVTGLVTHEGHTHARVNRYEAAFDLTETADGVRITHTYMRDLARLRSERADFEEWNRARADKALSPSELLRAGGGRP